MAREEQFTGLDPQVVFSLDAIIAAEGRREMDEGPLVGTEFKLNPGDVIVEAYRVVTGMAPEKAPEGQAHSLYPAAGAGAVIYFLQQLRPWLSTAADLAQLGALGLLILQKVREKLGADRRAVVFSKEIVRGCASAGSKKGSVLNFGRYRFARTSSTGISANQSPRNTA